MTIGCVIQRAVRFHMPQPNAQPISEAQQHCDLLAYRSLERVHWYRKL